jgi:LEA14-like dessication related protein
MRRDTLLSITIFFICGFQIFEEPEFVEVRNFRVHELGVRESKLKMELFYFNPNGFALTLKKADLDVFLDNRYLGKTILDTLIRIPARDTFYLPVHMQVNMKNLLPNAWTAISRKEVELKMEGHALVGKGRIFVRVPIHYSGRHELPLF